ncbi:ASCH domain-containing protein [Quadrisphaera sp. DSM 44207]|uniref:ASCH domain-containing protein n=1 Tax=Quadrisphaera sp. DSM 44207 TaxID=1881057 RepID=UPI0008836380|nr:ASCH domain-containing protein [Quadrisphaera sp. DSM 44207]SDQ74693.1 Uncharacterized protein YhfF [Quadrisphaera sp. DSM 44207]
MDVPEFWQLARARAGLGRLAAVAGETPSSAVPPPAWAFGRDAEQADELLALVLAGRKTATASALVEHAAEDEPLPRTGDLSIVLDGAGEPRALVRTTDVRVVRFADVDAAHAAAEGEGPATPASWRADHAAFWADAVSAAGLASVDDLDVVLERFELLHPRPHARAGAGAAGR